MIRHTLKYHVYMYAYVYRKVFILKIVLLLMKHIHISNILFQKRSIV